MEFEESVEKLSKEYGVEHGVLYDYMRFNLGLKLAINHLSMKLFNKEEFKTLRYNMTEHQLRNGYLKQNGYRLEKIVNREVPKQNHRRI